MFAGLTFIILTIVSLTKLDKIQYYPAFLGNNLQEGDAHIKIALLFC